MNKLEQIKLMWKKFILHEKALIHEYGLDKYRANVVFTIDNIPNQKCKNCFGRGYTARDITVNRVCPCGCLHGFALKAIKDLKDGELIMDFDGKISTVKEG